MTIVDTRRVCGGVDTHLDFHVAAALDHIGGLLGIETFETTEAGYRRLWEWLCGFGSIIRVGVEGTGSYGAGLARFLHTQEVEVVEVDRPNRQLRHRHGKSDPTDAVAAARAALSGQATGQPKWRNGPMEQMRILVVARRSARDQRIQTLNQIRHLVFCAPDHIRRRFQGASHTTLIKRLCALRPRPSGDRVDHTTLVTLRDLARRVRALDDELARIRAQLTDLVAAVAPSLLDPHGLGAPGAAVLLVAAGDNPQRLRSEAAWAHLCGTAPISASSGKTIRHRLNRGGNRQANSVLYQTVISRMSSDPRTRAYVARRREEGRSTGEIVRMQNATSPGKSTNTSPDPTTPDTLRAGSDPITGSRPTAAHHVGPARTNPPGEPCDLIRSLPTPGGVAHPCRVHPSPPHLDNQTPSAVTHPRLDT